MGIRIKAVLALLALVGVGLVGWRSYSAGYENATNRWRAEAAERVESALRDQRAEMAADLDAARDLVARSQAALRAQRAASRELQRQIAGSDRVQCFSDDRLRVLNAIIAGSSPDADPGGVPDNLPGTPPSGGR